ncbi:MULTISPECIES: winged helix-turn-helix domain-containing protein [unclassified Microbacterium]|uniref:winged helix-turn-helix domain-containing protein n=1 Tax=unclassified Microbacterium TaxID=2609290 RepID=UPI001ACD9A22|nr:helix-turn-helix domain-containing protein [Microbacterium sp.]MBN9158208.1 helix-turn-helix transcriptional regulator [Microbacterium sp.]MBS1897923.1 helix-turn-helix transcriptional regulator [Actinomycetota bacterium]MBS1901153.1 helix-turn-helix transcriptional regulator [Actinomycetota bacterium]
MTENEASRTDETSEERTLDAGALKALAHPLRVRILDLLAERGPQTASSLATLIGESSGVTSYHLRALAARDLIHEVADLGTARERWWERPRGRMSFSGPTDEMTPSGRAAAQIVEDEFFRNRHQRLMDHLHRPQSQVPQEWRDAAHHVTTMLDMTAAQLQELGERIDAVIDEAVQLYRDQSGPDVRRVTIRADLFDLPDARPRAAAQHRTTETEELS